MKKLLFLLTLVCLLNISSIAQTPDFSGEWSLDKAKSKLDERQANLIESKTLEIKQTEKEISVTVRTQQTGGQGQNSIDLGNGKNTYPLDGTEVSSETDTSIGIVLSKFKAEIKNGKLHLWSIRTFNTPNGDVSITATEGWELSADGKTLTIKREAESPQAKVSSEFVYIKKS